MVCTAREGEETYRDIFLNIILFYDVSTFGFAPESIFSSHASFQHTNLMNKPFLLEDFILMNWKYYFLSVSLIVYIL